MARIWVLRVAGSAMLIGVLMYGLLAYSVAVAGLGNPGTERLSCSRAATGEEVPGYRADEQLTLHRSYLPPTATCHYSQSGNVPLIRANWVSWAGPALIAASATTLIILRLTRKRRR
jgi:hypothetical protein